MSILSVRSPVDFTRATTPANDRRPNKHDAEYCHQRGRRSWRPLLQAVRNCSIARGSARFSIGGREIALTGAKIPERVRIHRIDAPRVFEGAIDGERFRAWVEQFLAPTLAPGDIVIMDNLSSHKVAGIREAVEAMGAELLYLPPYSPDLNPIEQVFAKLKALLRTAAARTVGALSDTIGNSLEAFLPAECANDVTDAGYSA
jgi:transposase